MLTTSHLNANLDECLYYIIPFDDEKSPAYKEYKVLPDGTVYIVNNEDQQVEEKSFPNLETTEQCDEQNTTVNLSSVIQKTDQSKTEKPLLPLTNDCSVPTKYICPKCDSKFTIVKEYKEHLKWHKSQKKFKCTKCPAGYDIENNFIIHNQLIHPGDNCIKCCPICGVSLTFKRLASLKSHLMVHQVEELHNCEECDAEFEKEDEYAKHMMTHSTKKKDESSSLTCSYCEVEFETKQQLKLHISDHTRAWKYFKKKRTKRIVFKEKRYNCDICKKNFIKQSLLERHERIHSGEKPFKCQICDQSFTQKGTLQIHLLKHTGDRPFACTLCPAKFNQKGNLRVHINKTHAVPNETQKMFKCPHCSCIFKRIASLNGHVTKAHLKYKSTTEDIIGNVMKNLKDLEGNNADSYVTLTSTSDGIEKKYVVQLRKVGDVKWYRCTYCPKMCKKPSDLIRHIRVHTKERPFVCKVCRKSFSLKSTLLSHMNTHTLTKSFKCSICDCIFKSSKQKNVHEKKHEKDKFGTWKCLTCDGITFGDFDAAMAHKAAHEEPHKIQPVKKVSEELNSKLSAWHCLTCGSIFNNFDEALQHRIVEEQPHKIQLMVNTVMKQPLYQTVYGNLTFKPPRSKVPNTGTESAVPRPFHCTICDARFTRKINLKRHIKGHEGDRKFKCNLCPKAFITSYRLKEHLNHHNNIKNYACKVCNKRFVTSTYLRRHMIIHNNLRPYTCPYCSKNFQTLDLSRRHIKLVHQDEVLAEVQRKESITEVNENVTSQATSVIISNISSLKPVDKKGQSFIDDDIEVDVETGGLSLPISTDVVEHADINNGCQTYFINLDDFQLLNSTGFNLSSIGENTENLQLASTETSAKESSIQNPVFMYTNNTSSLNTTSLTTVPETIFDNNVGFQTSGGLNEARNLFDDATINCMNCNRMFSSFVQFQEHTCTNTNKETNTTEVEKPKDVLEQKDKVVQKKVQDDTSITLNITSDDLQCPICNKNFKSSLSYKKHMKTHSCWECSKCKNYFTSKNAYLEHLLSHKKKEKDSDHVCMFCKKIFKKPSDLERHHRTHTGEKPYSCNICNKNFTLKATLKSHIKTHDPNHKQFVCNICDSFYSSKTSLKVHMTIHTGAKPYKCSICKAEFRTLGAKTTHETMGHRSVQKKRSKKKKMNQLMDILETATSQFVPDDKHIEEKQNQTDEVIPEFVPFENLGLVMNQNNLTSQTQTMDLSSQIVNLDIPPETILSTIPEDQITVDPSNLLQQLQMTDMVLSSNENDAVPSLILDDVGFLDLNAPANNLQIISLPETEGSGVTISIKENTEKASHKRPKQPMECDICFKMLASKDGLRKHKRTVHGEKKKLVCSLCGLKFVSKEMLKTHEELHVETRFCSVCSLTFDNKESLEEHVNSLHQLTEATNEETSALSNLKLDLQSTTMEDPLFNNLFLLKKM